MADGGKSMNDEIARFHRAVAEGGIDEVRAALAAGVDVNAPGHVGSTALMCALEARDLAKAALLLKAGADPEQTDDFNGTALRRAVEADFVEGVRLLLSRGVERGHHPRYPLKKISYNEMMAPFAISPELDGLLTEEEKADLKAQQEKSFQEWGENPRVEPCIRDVRSLEALDLFLAAGDDLNLAPTSIKRSFVGLPEVGHLHSSTADFDAGRSPRFGSENGEPMNVSFWRDMIRAGVSAYAARDLYGEGSAYGGGPVWCFDRFGASLTQLTDGRFVQVGGEHEDFYDPDFYIYNDVVVHDGRGDFAIYGYPRDVFPPTDFHSATLCSDTIYLIGGLGYVNDRRPGYTPVFRLCLKSWRIDTLPTSGEMPGWIHGHRAHFDSQRDHIRVENGELTILVEGEQEIVANESRHELDLRTLFWRRL
jgi:hypothetical protein